MELFLNPWAYGSRDAWSSIVRGIANGFCIGAAEGIIIYIVVNAFGVFDNIPIYG